MSRYVIVDVESDGPLIGENSMICFGAVILDKELNKAFYGRVKPISPHYEKSVLDISGFTREEHESFEDPGLTFLKFHQWIGENTTGKPVLLSDNNGYDASWINYYFLRFVGSNPFGWSSRRIGDLFCGFMNDPYYRWKKHRKTKHTHNPVDDALGNAEAMLYLIDQGFKLKI